MKHRLTVKNGKAVFVDIDYFKEELRGLEGKDCIISLSEYKSIRSNNQNRYYWGVVIKILSEHTGYFADELHEALRERFLNYKSLTLGGEDIPIKRSTTKLKTSEFEDYLSKIKVWAARDMGVTIPDPNEIKY
jgi:hypothetical protein